MKNKFFKLKKGTLVWNTLIPWIILVGFLVIAVIGIILLTDYGKSIMEYIKDLFRFKR